MAEVVAGLLWHADGAEAVWAWLFPIVRRELDARRVPPPEVRRELAALNDFVTSRRSDVAVASARKQDFAEMAEAGAAWRTSAEVARDLNVSSRRIRQLCGTVPGMLARGPDGSWRIPPDVVEAFRDRTKGRSR